MTINLFIDLDIDVDVDICMIYVIPNVFTITGISVEMTKFFLDGIQF